ncbi:hypothetical protein KSZ_32240 [Dictyobacter formicarum]|uniref:Uncharacterized protein n=1 Tax=Dictyobacter formicarum TaxID=2778368 RepID=A0ABQ3VIL0_9CHLR|nr:hypothetical protein KSZ_32240 [Dictyobacter formicarum]
MKAGAGGIVSVVVTGGTVGESVIEVFSLIVVFGRFRNSERYFIYNIKSG